MAHLLLKQDKMSSIKKVAEINNPLFHRKEVKINIEADITPSYSEAIKIVAKQFSCSDKVVKIIKIDSSFGTRIFTIIADIYSSEKLRESIAVKKKKEIEYEKRMQEEFKKEAEAKRQSEKSTANNSQKEIENTKIKQISEPCSETKKVEESFGQEE